MGAKQENEGGLSYTESRTKSRSSDKISYNSRAILVGLLALVGFILLVFTAAVNWFPSAGLGRLNTVFVAAISGSLALGGTLISQLWGRGDESNSPIVYSKTPTDGAINVSVNSSVSALFNKIMNGSTINKESFTLTFTSEDGKSESNIDATVKLEGGNAILKPTNPLNNSSKYTATIDKDVKDIEGNSMDYDVTWSFTTEASQ